MEQTYIELKERLGQVWDLAKVQWLLGWDQATMMPAGGGAVRAEQLATLTQLQHSLFTDDHIGHLLDRLETWEATLPLESDEASLIRVTRSDWTKARMVPGELAADLARAGAAGYQAWVQARKHNDFKAFQPYLERVLELKHRYVESFPDVAEPYDALIDDYERGLTAAEIREVFSTVRDGLVPLVRHVVNNLDAVDDRPMMGHFPAEAQQRLSLAILERWGFDQASWRLDPTEHPFASSISTTDIRITTRYDESNLGMALFGTLHECGHGLYEHGISPALERTPLCRGVSLGVHESQSRMWENLVGRSREFWTFAYPIAREIFPEHFAAHDEEATYRAVNKMAPSLIRVEADELTYSLHIILRFEIEQELFNGSLRAQDLPEVWNAKIKEYLGIEVPDDTQGVLQDVHWSEGLLGYFPTYALGSILASQLWNRIESDVPDLPARIAGGEFDDLREWLVTHVHQHGRKFTPKETIELAAGGPLDPQPYLTYLRRKVTSLYGPLD